MTCPGRRKIIHLPGHTPGSVAVWVPSVGALLVGDAMTTGHVPTGAQGPRPAPFTMDMPAQWLLPGHGPPWRGSVRDAIEQVRRVAAGS